MHRAGVKKQFLSLSTDEGEVQMCFFEKGMPVSGQPSLVFIHGFSSNKRTWLSVIKVH